uniref:Solute carrier family 26 member 9 n=1 Tax=Hucho hucho TaxID=62062 RepID=A0A4W5N817_9TELE
MQQERPRYVINRSAYSLPDFDVEFDKKKRAFPIGEKVKKCFRYSIYVLHLPILSWLPKYKVKENLLCDVISGVSAGTIQVPQGMAFALLANLPPVNGLYSSFFPLIPYFFMGTAHQMVPGTFAVLSIMVGMVCLRLIQYDTLVWYRENNTVLIIVSDLGHILSEQMGLGLMQFGFVAIYLSESFVRGFMTAAGLQILISVLKYIFGIKVPPYSGPLATIYVSLLYACRTTLLLTLTMIVVLITVKELSARYRHKLPFPIPMEIIVVVVATAISGPLDLPEKYHMDIVGEIPLGFPAPILPTVIQWDDMLSTAFSLAIVGYVINLAMGRTLAAKHGYDVDPNQVRIGDKHVFFIFSYEMETPFLCVSIHVICCALSVTLAVDNAGGTSQCVWVVSFLATFFLSLPYGVAIGVSFSILVVIFQTQL